MSGGMTGEWVLKISKKCSMVTRIEDERLNPMSVHAWCGIPDNIHIICILSEKILNRQTRCRPAIASEHLK